MKLKQVFLSETGGIFQVVGRYRVPCYEQFGNANQYEDNLIHSTTDYIEALDTAKKVAIDEEVLFMDVASIPLAESLARLNRGEV